MFSVGMGPVADAAFSITTMLIAVPTGVKILNWLCTLWGGSIRFTTPLYFSLGFIAMFTMGGLSGVMHASPPVDLQQTDTYFVVAHFHYVLFGGSIFGLFSGAYYWWPKITGKLLDERLGKVHFWLMMLGFNVTFFPQHYLGLIGMPRRIYTYAGDLGWNFWNLVSTIGAFTIARLVPRVHRQRDQDRARPARSRAPIRGTGARSSGRSRRRPRSTTSRACPRCTTATTSGCRSTGTGTEAPRGPSRPR